MTVTVTVSSTTGRGSAAEPGSVSSVVSFSHLPAARRNSVHCRDVSGLTMASRSGSFGFAAFHPCHGEEPSCVRAFWNKLIGFLVYAVKLGLMLFEIAREGHEIWAA